MCLRLWREYAEATTNHIRIDTALRNAALEQNFAEIESLTRAVETAESVRSAIRESIQRHEVEAHPETDGG
jgi:hypothetical protein